MFLFSSFLLLKLGIASDCPQLLSKLIESCWHNNSTQNLSEERDNYRVFGKSHGRCIAKREIKAGINDE